MKEKCLLCDGSFKHVIKHVVQTHGVSAEQYFIDVVNGGEVPECKCGCGQRVRVCRSSRICFRLFIDREHERKWKKDNRKPKIKRTRKNKKTKKIDCAFCDGSFGHLARHVRSTHGVDWVEYQIEHMYGGEWPTCECGCGENVQLRNGKYFNRFIRGHESRGRVLSESHKEKISAWSSAAMEARWRDDRDGMLDAHERARETFSERYTKDEWSDKISEAITKKYLDGGFSWSRGYYTSMKTGKTCCWRSSWELWHMMGLDIDDRISSWEYEPFSIEYEDSEKKRRRYIPDFLVELIDGTKEIHEVGVRHIKESIYDRKMNAGIEYAKNKGWKYVLIDKTEKR